MWLGQLQFDPVAGRFKATARRRRRRAELKQVPLPLRKVLKEFPLKILRTDYT